MELLWLNHTETVAHLAQNAPSQVRRYLTSTKDFAMLSAWDQQQLKDKKSDGGEQ